jgi:hypothetical protein
MTTIALKNLAERRQNQKKRIMANPAGYKVCCVCCSISFKEAPYCPLCRAYRFVQDETIVEVVSTFSAKFALPITAAFAPRTKPAE